MRVSVVIPTWNQKALLAECLESLARQTFRDFDTWVVDDASADGTAQAVGERFPWAQVHRQERNGGFCEAVNAGIEHAAGDYVVLLNDDMTLAPDFLERLVAVAESSGAGLVGAPHPLARRAGCHLWRGGRPMAQWSPGVHRVSQFAGRLRFPREGIRRVRGRGALSP